MARLYACKHCGEKFERKGNRVCPHCNQPWHHAHKEQPSITDQITPPDEVEQKPAGIVFDEGIVGGITICFDGKNKYTIDFPSGMIENRWVNCPACNRKLFQNQDLRGTSSHRCPRCKANILLQFH